MTDTPGIEVEADVAFSAANRGVSLDLYRPTAARESAPAVLYFHGGSFWKGDKGDARSVTLCRMLAASGFVAASVNYRLAASGTGPGRWTSWPGNLEDCRAALRFVGEDARRLGVDPERLAVMGSSAGATLALLLAFRPDRGSPPLRALVNFYGRVDCELHTPVDKRPTSPAIARDASPLRAVPAALGLPPILTIHGDADAVVSVEHGRLLHATLATAGFQHELLVLRGAPHAFALEPDPDLIRSTILSFLGRHLAVGVGLPGERDD